MKTKIIDHYVIEGDCFYHIEEGDVFDEKRKGFRIWCGGSGIGFVKTIEEARIIIFEHSRKSLLNSIEELKEKIKIKEESLKKLGDDNFNLGMFKNPDYHGYECNFFNGKKG